MPDLNSTTPLLQLASKTWDLLVIGGGITGAGILREAARLGQRVLLVEKNDFASGTSSRSGKLVHGGLHYLARLQTHVVRDAVAERERMIRTNAELVTPLEFFLPVFDHQRTAPLKYSLLLGAYDGFAGRLRMHRSIPACDVAHLIPGLGRLRSVFSYHDAQTDDARLVLRTIYEGCRYGGVARNYATVSGLIRSDAGRVIGARLYDRETSESADIRAHAVVNATGAWADGLRGKLGASPRLRLSRGSHLIFPHERLPVYRAVALRHPDLPRAMYVVPWEGVTLVGCTDVPHEPGRLDEEPRASADEASLLLRGVQALFPSLGLNRDDIRATYAGIRPLVDTHTSDAAKASREHAIWEENGLLTVTGGKLTTHRTMALETLRRLHRWLPTLRRIHLDAGRMEDPFVLPTLLPFSRTTALRLHGRYGPDALDVMAQFPAEECRPMPGLQTLWGELRWAARSEGARHLEDLLLRRLRIGLTAPHLVRGLMPGIRSIVQRELGWDDEKWRSEEAAYFKKVETAFSVPEF